MSAELRIEISVDEKWEASYALTRSSMDKVYQYMDLLQLEENDEVDITSINTSIREKHDLET